MEKTLDRFKAASQQSRAFVYLVDEAHVDEHIDGRSENRRAMQDGARKRLELVDVCGNARKMLHMLLPPGAQNQAMIELWLYRVDHRHLPQLTQHAHFETYKVGR